MTYEMTIGIECHVQLNTKTKLFAPIDNDANDKEPNSCVGPICYALPGMLPRLNEEAVKKAVQVGLALGSNINLHSRFDRKHYYYPDLPKGYQISQLYEPIISEGQVELPDGTKVRVEHAHLEEDAGKLSHFGEYSLVDLNRAGTPLVEIVSMPDIHSAAHARDYCKELWRLMTFAGVSDGDLYHGNMRFDVNISVAEKGAKKLGTRAEIKNLNSFRSVERAAEYEFKRQVELIESGEKVKQETRGWSDATGKTTSQRSKEEAQDYRYMPDPDIPPVNLTQDFVDTIKAAMPLLPPDFRAKFSKLKIQASALETLLDYPALANRLAEVLDNSNVKITEKVANLFTSVLLAEENTSLLNDPLPSAPNLIELSEMADSSELSSTAMKAVFLKFFNKDTEGKSARELAKEMNLLQENDESALEKIVDEVLALPETKQAQEDIKNGEMKALGFLVGQIMKHSQGKANPAAVQTLLKKKLA